MTVAPAIKIDYEHLVGECRKQDLANFHNFDSFDAERSQRISYGLDKEDADWTSSDEEDEDIWKSKKRSFDADREASRMFKRPPDSMRPPADYACQEEFICDWITWLIGAWKKDLSSEESILKNKETFGDPRILKQSEVALKPLVRQLVKRQLDETVVHQIHGFVMHCYDRNYQFGHSEYIKMILGSTKWFGDVCHGEARFNKGYNFRKLKCDAGKRIFDDDESKNYCLTLRRLLMLSQNLFVSHDRAQHV